MGRFLTLMVRIGQSYFNLGILIFILHCFVSIWGTPLIEAWSVAQLSPEMPKVSLSLKVLSEIRLGKRGSGPGRAEWDSEKE